MKYSVVIPTYNHCEDFLKPCLESIKKFTDLNDIEIIVSANGCKDNTKEYVESLGYPFKLVWNAEPLGYTKSTNEGIKVAKGDYIILLNNDTALLDQKKNTWLEMLTTPFEKDPQVGITGPMQAYCPYAKRNFLIFFCVMVKREMFDKIGLLDETFNPGFGEDTDFCIKLQDLGYKIVQIPDYNTKFDKPNFMIGGCPIYHKGEGTFANWPGGQKLLAERRFMLMNRYAKEIKLNLGSGDRPLKGYFNIDISNPKNDLAWDVRTIPLDDNKVDEIMAIHLIEHFKIQEIETILLEWLRVLKPEGKLILEFPNVKALFKAFETANPTEKNHLLHCIYGAHTPEFPHLFGWHGDSIWELLNKIGFHQIEEKNPEVNHWGINMRIECRKGSHLPDGFFGDTDIATYREMMKKIPIGGKIAELGCWKGRSICSVADIIKERNINVTVVDTFQGTQTETEGQASPVDAVKQNVKEVFLNNIKRFGLTPTVLQMTTHEASQKFKDNYFDMVFIDADHSFEGCRQDIQDWYPKVKRGGFLAGHDCMWKSVAEALTAEFGHLVLTNKYNVWWYDKGKVYDCFPFCNEFDQLEIRLNELDKEVDYFVLVEGTETHSGQKKPLYYTENKDRFKKWKDRIIHLVTVDWPEYVKGVPDSSWARERKQRAAIMAGLKNVNPYDILILGDADEIISAKALRSYRRHMGLCRLEMNLYYYFLNYQSSDGDGKWYESRIISVEEFRRLNLNPCTARYVPVNSLPMLKDAGWHFSFQGGVEEVMKKIKSWAHQEYNRPDILDRNRIEKIIDEGKDVFGRANMTYKTVPIDETFPKYVRENQSRFKNMIRKTKDEQAMKSEEKVNTNSSVTAIISTKNRYHTTLPLTVLSIINQTYKIDRLIIFDDGDRKDLREDPLWQNIFLTLSLKGIKWEVKFGEGKGQVLNHQKSIDLCETEWIWRLDDDNYAEPNALEKLLEVADEKTGAVGGLVLDPKLPPTSNLASNKIEDIYLGLNKQWFRHEGISEVDHLYSTFIYRKEASDHGYCMDLSPVGFREETLFTYEMKRNGWKIKINPASVTWHYKNSEGGLRETKDPKHWAWDDSVLAYKLKEWKIEAKKYKLIVLDNGLGDHLAFLNILPELKEKYKDIIIANCYPEVFQDEKDITLISIAEARTMCNIDEYNIYRKMWDWNHKTSLVEAFRRLYLS